MTGDRWGESNKNLSIQSIIEYQEQQHSTCGGGGGGGIGVVADHDDTKTKGIKGNVSLRRPEPKLMGKKKKSE